MATITVFIKRHALVTFFALAYALSWWLSLFEAHSILPLGPLLAALLVLPFTDGWAGVKDFLRRIVRWRVSPRWYLLALGLPAALAVTAVGLNVLLGAGAPMWERVPPLSELPGVLLFILIAIGLGEEPAWRGFALPRLAAGRSALAGGLLLWALHAVWHLPLFGLEYDFQNGLPWLLMLLGGTIFSTWLYYRTNGNLLLPVLFHTSVNVGAKYLFLPLFKRQRGDPEPRATHRAGADRAAAQRQRRHRVHHYRARRRAVGPPGAQRPAVGDGHRRRT